MAWARSPRFPVHLSAFALAGAGGWVAVVLLAHNPAVGMSATMGLPPAAFLGAWTLMTAAMMLPAAGPVASLYARSFDGHAGRRLIAFGLGYLLAWAALGVPAYVVATAVDSLAQAGVQRWLVVAILLAVAAYELTPLKAFCLAQCHSPLTLVLRYAGYRGSTRDLRAGAHHGLYCAGCCWPLMLLLVAVGTMNLAAMLALTVVIAAEKLLRWERAATRVVAAAAVATALAFAAVPALYAVAAGG